MDLKEFKDVCLWNFSVLFFLFSFQSLCLLYHNSFEQKKEKIMQLRPSARVLMQKAQKASPSRFIPFQYVDQEKSTINLNQEGVLFTQKKGGNT